MFPNDPISTLEKAEDAPTDPLPLFQSWLSQAEKTEPVDPNAMCLSTIEPDGRIGSRIVLLKELNERGFVFYTNRESHKGDALRAHPFAALNFYWKSLGRQVRIEGPVEPNSNEDSDAYFASRPRGSRIGAWASLQSQPLKERRILLERIEKYEQEFENKEDIPRPARWGGYVLAPRSIEFWHEAEFRLHRRVVYTRTDSGWDREMMFP